MTLSLTEHFTAIRAHYAAIQGEPYVAYYDEFPIRLTPIELNVWADLRQLHLEFYPQYPIGRYFADFADPVRKIVVECDGKQWHDAARDEKRDEAMRALGWWVIRIPGWRCNLPDEDERSSFRLLKKAIG